MGQVLHGCATTTEAIRRAIQNSQDFHAATILVLVGLTLLVAGYRPLSARHAAIEGA